MSYPFLLSMVNIYQPISDQWPISSWIKLPNFMDQLQVRKKHQGHLWLKVWFVDFSLTKFFSIILMKKDLKSFQNLQPTCSSTFFFLQLFSTLPCLSTIKNFFQHLWALLCLQCLGHFSMFLLSVTVCTECPLGRSMTGMRDLM